MVKFTVQMHADLTFLKRELHTDEALPAAVMLALDGFARAFEDSAGKVAALARGRSAQEVEIKELRKTCGEAAEVLRESCPGSEGARLMLRRFLEDFGALIHSIERAQPLRR